MRAITLWTRPGRPGAVARAAAAAVILLACACRPCWAADGGLEADVKAAYVYNFFQFVEWGRLPQPAEAAYNVCLAGEDPVNAPLRGIGGREVAGRRIAVSSLPPSAEGAQSCHILYIGASERARLPDLLASLRGRKVLTVSSLPGFAGRGGMIGFVTEKGRVRLEINLRAARGADIWLSAKLLEIARLVPENR